MKNRTSKLNVRRFLFLGFLFFSFLEQQGSDLSPILDLQCVYVDKGRSAVFLINLDKGDFVSTSWVLGKGSKAANSDLEVKLIDLTSNEIRYLAHQKALRADNKGKYKVEFNSKKLAYLDLKISKSNDPTLESPGSVTHLKSNAIFIDEKKSNEPAFKQVLKLKAGDQVAISSADPKANLLQCYLPRTGEVFAVKDKPVIEITDDGNYSFEFYVDRNSPGLFKRLKEEVGLDSKNFYFSDLSLIRTRPAIASNPTTATTGAATTKTQEAFNPTALIESSNKQLAEMMERSKMDNAEREKFLEEMANRFMMKDTAYTSNLGASMNIKKEVSGELNYAKGNRIAEKLEIDQGHYWIYWLGVGDGGEKAFKEKNQAAMETGQGKSIFKLFSERIIKNQPTNSSLFPTVEQFPSELFEDVEYAILDEINKNHFLRGEPYTPFDALTQGIEVTTHFGFAKVPDGKQELYLCVANNNKMSPVNVFFQYQTFQIEQEIK